MPPSGRVAAVRQSTGRLGRPLETGHLRGVSTHPPPRVMIDASHGNSGKDFRRQPVVASAIAEQVAAGEAGISGVMLESFLVDGRQELSDRTHLTVGQSI